MGMLGPFRGHALESAHLAEAEQRRQTEILVAAATGIDRIASELGSDPLKLLAKHQLLPDRQGRTPAAIPLRSYTQLLEEAAELTGEDHFGLLFGRRFNMTDLGPNGYVMLHARTVGDGLAHFARHFGDLQEGSHVSLDLHGDLARIVYEIDDPRVKHRHQDAEFTIMTIHNFFRRVFGQQWQLEKVDLAHAPKRNQRRHDQLLDTAVGFRKRHNALYIRRALLELELPSYDPLLLRHLEGYFQARHGSRGGARLLTKRVSLQVDMELDRGGAPHLEDVAETLGLSPRSLHRRLAAEGTSYRTVLQDCRLNAAKALLRDTDIPLTTLGIQMGYSDATAFSRAFKKKTGLSPVAWRGRCRTEGNA